MGANNHLVKELRFTATSEKGEVSALLMRPEGSTHLLVFGHGASTTMRHATLERIAEALAEQGIGTFRYNFPYSEHGTSRNSTATCVETIRNAVRAAHEAAPDLTLLAGGHSFGGRMTTTAQSEEPLEDVRGLVLFSFPLHAPGRRETQRAGHLSNIKIPMLFLSGSRDEFAALDLWQPIVKKLKSATLHLIDTANHSYKVLKKTRTSTEDVFVEMARVIAEWARAET
jgi:predicted alpha/beta-hydrolase family hydrolase